MRVKDACDKQYMALVVVGFQLNTVSLSAFSYTSFGEHPLFGHIYKNKSGLGYFNENYQMYTNSF